MLPRATLLSKVEWHLTVMHNPLLVVGRRLLDRKLQKVSNGHTNPCYQKKYEVSYLCLLSARWLCAKLAKAGFFFYPSQTNPDNCACFLCHRSIDAWEEGDDPLKEHLKHSPNCGWAIVASIEAQDEELSREFPASLRMVEARTATFAGKWPHEAKRGWKCKTKQVWAVCYPCNHLYWQGNS